MATCWIDKVQGTADSVVVHVDDEASVVDGTVDGRIRLVEQTGGTAHCCTFHHLHPDLPFGVIQIHDPLGNDHLLAFLNRLPWMSDHILLLLLLYSWVSSPILFFVGPGVVLENMHLV